MAFSSRRPESGVVGHSERRERCSPPWLGPVGDAFEGVSSAKVAEVLLRLVSNQTPSE